MPLAYNTANQTFRQTMGNGLKYTVPRFQRDYSWNQEQWHDLWQDIRSSQTESEPHYMGYLVFESKDSKNFVIIDGQQRLATVSILILAAMDCLRGLAESGIDPESNKERAEALRGSFIGFKDSVSLEIKNKITLNQNSEAYFRDYLCPLKPLPQRNVKASERLMGLAFEYFKKQFENGDFPGGGPLDGADGGGSQKGRAIASFVEDLADRLVFTAITVGDEVKAYAIFETLNARGVQLSAPDLVKNYIFSLMASHQKANESLLAQMDDRWSAVTKQLERLSFSDFIRADWNSGNPLARRKDLFKKIKAEINSREKADKYLDRLRQSAEIYAALKHPKDDFWKTCRDGKYNRPGLADGLKTLKMFNIASPMSALIAAFRRFEADKFVKFLSYVEAVAVRWRIIGSPGHQEETYSKIAKTVMSQGSLKTVRGILREIYPNDEAFLSSFKRKAFKVRNTENQARYILARIENYLSEKPVDESRLTLEHILPKEPSPEWREAFQGEDIEGASGLIGNMTLLSSAENRRAGRLGFDKKKLICKESALQTARQIAEYDKWGMDSILSRQGWLGEQAAKVWRIPPD